MAWEIASRVEKRHSDCPLSIFESSTHATEGTARNIGIADLSKARIDVRNAGDGLSYTRCSNWTSSCRRPPLSVTELDGAPCRKTWAAAGVPGCTAASTRTVNKTGPTGTLHQSGRKNRERFSSNLNGNAVLLLRLSNGFRGRSYHAQFHLHFMQNLFTVVFILEQPRFGGIAPLPNLDLAV